MSGTALQLEWGLSGTNAGPHSNHANIGIVLSQEPAILGGAVYDGFLDRILKPDGSEWTDADDTRVCMDIQERIEMHKVTPGMVSAVINQRLRATPRHAVRDWLDTVTWDGVDRIAMMLEDFFGAVPGEAQPSEYLRAVSANLMLSMIARIRMPGCQSDHMVVLEGAQGIGKSQALRVLGGAWYALAAESVTSKDFFQSLVGVMLAEVGELDAFSRAEKERVKVVVSAQVDRYRPSYGRRAVDHPRQVTLVGTTNRHDWGNDDTGLRRFWPVRCGVIDLSGLAAARAQLFAEADTRIRNGDPWWIVPSIAAAIQADRQAIDVWTDPVHAAILGKDEITMIELLRDVIRLRDADMTVVHERRVGKILTLAGWESKNRRRAGKQMRVWVAPDEDA